MANPVSTSTDSQLAERQSEMEIDREGEETERQRQLLKERERS